MRIMLHRLLRRSASGAAPILIYQMGKVGSTTIKLSIDRLNRFETYHVHRLNPDNIARVKREQERHGWPPRGDLGGLELYERMIRPRMRLRIITLVREPIGRNLSYYFNSLDKIYRTPDTYERIPTEQLVRDFPVEFPYSDDPLTWFEYEFKEVMGIDLYGYQLNMERGFAEVKTDLYDVLVLRTDAADQTKEEALARFLRVDRVPLVRANATTHKAQAQAYCDFRNSIRTVPAYLDRMLGSRYSCHFFDEVTLARLRDQYSQTGSIIPDSFLELKGAGPSAEGNRKQPITGRLNSRYAKNLICGVRLLSSGC